VVEEPTITIYERDWLCARAGDCRLCCVYHPAELGAPPPVDFRCPLTGLPVQRWVPAIDAPEEVWEP